MTDALDQAISNNSFECDGCGHHASFHDMENATDEKVMSGWAKVVAYGLEPITKKRKAKAITNGSNDDDDGSSTRRSAVGGTTREESALR